MDGVDQIKRLVEGISVLESVAVLASRKENKIVDREAIATVITELTHIPVTKLTQDESQSLLNLEEKIHQRVIGQDEAVKMVSAALRRARVELRETKRPIANFLFLGPTGVGKTELAKAVAETYFGREDYMIRIDMSEYQNSDSVNKMIGSPEGVSGYLTEAVRKMPFSLILLDEIEKAHPDILNLFLQVMDDGRLTDGH
jgi:ATP-dependent Clp protease ATP-binding subunit ClpC